MLDLIDPASEAEPRGRCTLDKSVGVREPVLPRRR